METPHAETVVDKAVTFVKEVLGIHPAPDEPQPEYHTAPEATAETRLQPKVYGTTVGEVNAETNVRPLGNSEDERLRRVIDEQPREKSALELNAESARAEEGA
jgi:hypothetical protein